MNGNGQPPYPPSPQNNDRGDDNVDITDDNGQPPHSPQNNVRDDNQHKAEGAHKRNYNDGDDRKHSSRRGRKERRRRKRNRHNSDEPLNNDIHHHMQRNHPERCRLENLMNQPERHSNNDREMRAYNIDRDHNKSKGNSRRRRDDRINDELRGSNMRSANHRRSHSWSSPRKQHNHQSSSRRRSSDNYRRKRSRSRSRSDDSRFDERRKRNSSRRAMKRYSRSYSRDRSSSSISTRRKERRRDDSSRRRDRGRHRYSSSSSRERPHRRVRRHRRRRDEGHRPNRGNNNIQEGQNNNNREEGNDGIRIVVSEDSDNHLGAVGGKADTAAVAIDQMERPSRGDSGEAELEEDKSMESDRKKSASGKKSKHRNRSRRSSPSSRSSYSSRSTRCYLSPQGNQASYRGGGDRSYSHSPPFRNKVASSKKKKKRDRRRRDRSSSVSLSRSRSRDRRISNYSRSSSFGSRHRSLSPRMYNSHGHQREHSFSSSRSGYKKQNKRRHKKNKKKDKKKKKHESHHSGSSRDDTVGHFRGGPGTVIDNRYRIIRDVGLGTFGRVVQCETLRPNHRQTSSSWYDHQQDNLTTVAIKVVRNIQRYHESAIIEADICERINMEQSRQKKDLCATLLDRFSLSSGHYCLAFECLGKSLYDFLKMHKYRPFPMFCVRDFAQQLLETLEFLHGFGLIHTDLKVIGCYEYSFCFVPYGYS